MDTPFFGAAYASRSTNYADCKLQNLYCEVSETKQGKNIGALYLMPGLAFLTTAGSGPIAGAHTLSGVGYVVSGTQLYSIDPVTHAPTLLGSVAAASPNASIIDNGVQMGVLCGSNLFVYSVGGGLVGPVTLPFTPAGTLAYQDGFGLACAFNSNEVFQSNLLDLTTWNPLAFGSASGESDSLVAAFVNQRVLYLLKQSHTEVWTNQGTSPFAFGRLDGAYMEWGCSAQFSIVRLDETVIWLARNEQGQGRVVELRGLANAVRISDHALETEIQNYGLTDNVAYGLQFNGHSLYVLQFPSNNVTWVYDKTTSDILKMPIWFQWLAPGGGRHQSNCFMNLGGQLIVGDFSNGNIYQVKPSVLQDNLVNRTWLRTWRALAKPTQDPTRFSSLTIDMETGGTGTVGSPTVSLRWSDDGGHNWSAPITASAGTLNQTTLRVKFNRLGSTRRTTGLDRIFELSSSSIFPAALINAILE